MSINRTEATRLAGICLPQILANSGTGIDDNCYHDEVIKTTSSSSSNKKSSSLVLSEEHVSVKSLCHLWAGMGYIYQVAVAVAMPSSSSSSSLSLPNKKTKQSKSKTLFHHQFIIKHIVIPPPPLHSHRSGGDERKAYSYFIEANFYQHLAPILIEKYDLAIPIPFHVELNNNYHDCCDSSQQQVMLKDDTITICMSLLHGSPSSNIRDDVAHIQVALSWLATLHAATWGDAKVDAYVAAKIIHPIGSYWHLDTRPDEHENMTNLGWEGRLKRAARGIHERLRRDAMQCCIHGDAKDANMLFMKITAAATAAADAGGGVSVSMYDFQYCGKAPPSVSIIECDAIGCSC